METMISLHGNQIRFCLLAVFLSSSESQGIALAEAWSMNVPTFVWNPKPKELNGRYFPSVDSAPYLTPETEFPGKLKMNFRMH